MNDVEILRKLKAIQTMFPGSWVVLNCSPYGYAWTFCPRGSGMNPVFVAKKPYETAREAMAELDLQVRDYNESRVSTTVGTMAVDIVRSVAEHGRYHPSDLKRFHYSEAEIATYGDMALEEAKKISAVIDEV